MKIEIHDHYSDKGTEQRAQVAEMIRLGIEDGMSYDDIASTIIVRLLNP